MNPQRIELALRDCTAEALVTLGIEGMRLLEIVEGKAVFVPQIILHTDKKVTVIPPEVPNGQSAT